MGRESFFIQKNFLGFIFILIIMVHIIPRVSIISGLCVWLVSVVRVCVCVVAVRLCGVCVACVWFVCVVVCGVCGGDVLCVWWCGVRVWFLCVVGLCGLFL